MMKLAKDSFDLGILVNDIKDSLDFYQKILGLEFVEEKSLPFGRMFRLRAGSGNIKLIQPYTKPPKSPIGLEDQLGFRYVTFLIRNFSELCKELRSKGVEFVQPEQEFRPGMHFAIVKDPDGNFIEFVESN
jgi:catechol 2,3-dioxygenase-like lactoylglutathione lyase family enzyme